MNNVLFVEPVPERVKEITYRLSSYSKVPASYSEVSVSYPEVGTNTETTPEIKNNVVIAESLQQFGLRDLPLFNEFIEPEAAKLSDAERGFRQRELFICLEGSGITADAVAEIVTKYGFCLKPNVVRAWSAYAEEQAMKNPGGFVRKMIQEGCYPTDQAWEALKRKSDTLDEVQRMFERQRQTQAKGAAAPPVEAADTAEEAEEEGWGEPPPLLAVEETPTPRPCVDLGAKLAELRRQWAPAPT
jgi:hypothetical protein